MGRSYKHQWRGEDLKLGDRRCGLARAVRGGFFYSEAWIRRSLSADGPLLQA